MLQLPPGPCGSLSDAAAAAGGAARGGRGLRERCRAGSCYGNRWVRGSVKRRVTPSLTAMSHESSGGGSMGGCEPPASPLPPLQGLPEQGVCPSQPRLLPTAPCHLPGSPAPRLDAATCSTMALVLLLDSVGPPPAHQPINWAGASHWCPHHSPPHLELLPAILPLIPSWLFQHRVRVMLDNPYVCKAEALGYPPLIQLAVAVWCHQHIALFLGGTGAAPATASWAGTAPAAALWGLAPAWWQLPRAAEQNQPCLHGALELL